MEKVAPASMRASAISKETQGNSFASCPIHSRWRRIAELVLTPGI
jgi:hypothetical protein